VLKKLIQLASWSSLIRKPNDTDKQPLSIIPLTPPPQSPTIPSVQTTTPMPRVSNLSTEALVSFIQENHGNEFGSEAVRDAATHFEVSYPTAAKRLESFKSGYGRWNLTVAERLEQTFEAPAAEPAIETPQMQIDLIPRKDDSFVSFGNFSDIKKVISSGQFYPVFITGLSGNGKTFGVEQACAQLKRELIRVNITIETDEDDLIGGFRLVNGNTVWHNGPVIEAMQRGAVLLLDEIDLASNKIMCLQSILEGTGVFLKKIGQFIKPSDGFNVIATANTKGKGSDDGRFIGTNVLNEAFLERFPVTFEQDYPTIATETKILNKLAEKLGCPDEEFVDNLTKWADIIRRTFKTGGVDEVISTRRLVHVIRAFSIFKNRKKAIDVCINRFDDVTKQGFLDLYGKVDAKEEIETEAEEATPATF
jgi:MoxR-like ATPase